MQSHQLRTNDREPQARERLAAKRTLHSLEGSAGSVSSLLASNLDVRDDCVGEHSFTAMAQAFTATGGLQQIDELRRTRTEGGMHMYLRFDELSRHQSIFGFQWQRTLWFPMFQFDQNDLSIKLRPRQVRMELGRDFNGWEVCCWFAAPNSWLRDQRPVDVLAADPGAVLQAARADRFVVSG